MAGIELDLESISDNPEDLAKAFAQLEGGDLPVNEAKPEPEPKAQAEDDREQKDQQQQQGAQPEGEPEGVATKDGKHVIPYSVLKNERDRASRAEQMAREMVEKVAALEAQVKAQAAGANNGEDARTDLQEAAVDDLSPADLETLKEDFPTVYKAVMASMAAAKALEAKLKPVEETVQQTRAEAERSAAETVQDAIDSVPKLAHIQATNAEAFELAKQFDGMLRTQSAWAEKSLAERFAKVAEMVENAIGPIEIPGAKSRTPSAEELRAAAKAKADAAVKASRANVPTSLSEFPAGQHAAQDEREEAETLTPLQLAEKFSAMTPEQMDAYFRTL